jgi:hypothetical protein
MSDNLIDPILSALSSFEVCIGRVNSLVLSYDTSTSLHREMALDDLISNSDSLSRRIILLLKVQIFESIYNTTF